MTAHSSVCGGGSGYGAIAHRASRASDNPASGHAQGAAADAGLASSRMRRGVVACLLATSVAIATLAFVSTPPSDDEADLAIPSIILSAPVEPSVLLSVSAPEHLRRMNEASRAPVVQAARVTELAPEGKLTAFPHWKYNIFDPKPLFPHHRWTPIKLREEARRLELLVDESKAWEDQKDNLEKASTKEQYSWMDEVLANVSSLESAAQQHMAVVQRGLALAERRIMGATDVTYGLQGGLDHDLERTKAAVWEIIMEHGKDLHWDEMLQAYKDRQVKKDMEEDGEMNYLKVRRYKQETEEQKERIHEWIRGLRGRIEANLTQFQDENIKLQHLFKHYESDEHLRMDDNYEKAMHLKVRVGQAVQEDATEGVHIKEVEALVEGSQQQLKQDIETAAKVSDSVDSLDTLIGDQHLEDDKQMLALTEQYEKLKSQLSMLIKSLTILQSAMQQQQEAHAALKVLEDAEMTKMKQAVENLKPELQSVLDLEGVIKTLHDGTQSRIDDSETHFNNVKVAQEKSVEDDAALQDQINLLNRSITTNDGFINSDGFMLSYDEIEKQLKPVAVEEDELKILHATMHKTRDDFNAVSAGLIKQVTSIQEDEMEEKRTASKANHELMDKVNTTIAREQAGIAGMFSSIKVVNDRIEEMKDFKDSSIALRDQLRRQLAETTQALENMDQQFAGIFADVTSQIEKLSNTTETLASPEEIKEGGERVGLRVQETLDGSENVLPQVQFITQKGDSQKTRLDKLQERLRVIKRDTNLALMRAREMLNRHPNLLERISCVCYDGDKLNGKCIAGSLADQSTCDPCPAGSYCRRGAEIPCKTTCPGGLVLTRSCAIGSSSDVTTCEPCPAGSYSETGKAIPCRTTCDPGFELRGTCPVGSSSDTTRCASCPAGFYCQDGKTHECKTSCEAGLVLTGKCARGSSTDVTTCEPCPVGSYSEAGVAIPCRQSCQDGKYITGECPAGSKSDTSECSECPEGHYCKGGKAIPCKTTCADGEELTGSCPAGSAWDVTVCMRCPEEHYCVGGKKILCATTCEAGKYLEGRCRKGSTEDTTKCRTCKSGYFCPGDGKLNECRKGCDDGRQLSGECPRGSAKDTTTCELCPENTYCTALGGGVSSRFDCKTRCWEGKVLNGRCPAGSSKDTSSCDICPKGYWCNAGVATKCKTQCDDGLVFGGECPERSVSDTTTCSPCPAGKFCKDNKVESCKSTCPDGQLLQGFCRAGSTTDKTECVPCPSGSFCKDGKAQECVKSCPNGQRLVGECGQGSSTAITKCEPCPAGSFCRDMKVEVCKTTCAAGEYLTGACEAGSSKDKTTCEKCPDGFYCADGKKNPCKVICPAGQQLNGKCPAGSGQDGTSCDPCPVGSFCVDGIAAPCKTAESCAVGQQFVGECAAGSGSDTTSCDPCPPGSYCRHGTATPCRTTIDCPDGHKIDGSCPQGSSLNPECKPCRAGVFCVAGEDTPCKATCEAGKVLEGFCSAGSASDVIKCVPAPAGSYSTDGVAIPCKATCEVGKQLGGSCPEGSTSDTVTCTPCPEGSWCVNGIAAPCTTSCFDGQILTGSCPAGSGQNTAVCNPCPAGNFCNDGEVKPCKTECPDGKFLEGECAVGSAEDGTRCTPCPSGSFCAAGKTTNCATSCPNGQVLQGFCAAGSTQDTTTCVPCPAGSFCTGGVAKPCKTACDDGEEFKGTCAEGSGTDTTTCEVCPAGFYCQDGLKAECKKSCQEPLKLEGSCSAGSVKDSTRCVADRTPLPFFIEWWKEKSSSENLNEYSYEHSDNFGGETRYTGAVGGSGFIEGRKKLPLPGGKWNVHLMVWWPAYDQAQGMTIKKEEVVNPLCTNICPRIGGKTAGELRANCKACDKCEYHTQCGCKPKECTCGDKACIFGDVDKYGSLYPLEADGQEVDDIVKLTINGKEILVQKPGLPGVSTIMTDVVGDEVVWRFDFTSKTPTVNARPYIVSGQVTILRDSSTGDEGSGMGKGGGFLKGIAENAVDGQKIMAGKSTHNGFVKKSLPINTETRLMLFKKSELITQVTLTKGVYDLSGIVPGDYTCVALCEGMMAFYDDGCQVTTQQQTLDLIMSPFLVDGNIRVVITWGPLIKDLDSYMLVPPADVTDPPCEVSYTNTACLKNTVKLDKDDKNGGGPETITILNVFPGRYRYRVSEYIKGGGGDNVERLKKSEARVSVYTSTGMKQFEVGKEGSGFVKGNNWYVFTIDGFADKIYECTADTCGT